MIVVIMGVCGSGKTTVGETLANEMSWCFADADGFHSKANKDKMAQGIPLTDQDRFPWLADIHNYMKQLILRGQSGVLTCSALKTMYRTILKNGYDEKADGKISDDEITDNKISDDKINNKPTEEVTAAIKLEPNTKEPSKESVNGNITTEPDDQLDEQKSAKSLDIYFVHLHGPRELLQTRLSARKGHFMPAGMLESQLKTLEPLMENENGHVADIRNSPADIVAEIRTKLGL